MISIYQDNSYSYLSLAIYLLVNYQHLQNAYLEYLVIWKDFVLFDAFFMYFTHKGKSSDKVTTNQEALFKMLSFSLVQCIFTYARSQYIFGEGLLEIQQAFSLFFVIKLGQLFYYWGN